MRLPGSLERFDLKVILAEAIVHKTLLLCVDDCMECHTVRKLVLQYNKQAMENLAAQEAGSRW
jgi:hypothetical protein